MSYQKCHSVECQSVEICSAECPSVTRANPLRHSSECDCVKWDLAKSYSPELVLPEFHCA